MRVHSLTLNPAIDQTVMLDRLVPGEVHRARSVRQNAGGKGVNVASCLADWGVPVIAHGLLGSDNAAPFDALFEAKAIDNRCVRIAGATRVNLKLVDRDGTTDINLDGIAVDENAVGMVVATLGAAAQPGDLVILSGSVPPGCPFDIYVTLTARLKHKGCRVLLDTSGPPLKSALDADILPDIVKPNWEELCAWTGQADMDQAALMEAAHTLLRRGVGLVVISMGGEGALFMSEQGSVSASLPLEDVASTVGAGDAMVAGIAAGIAENAGLDRLARLSTAFAVGKLGMVGPNLPAPGSVQALAAEVNVAVLEGIQDDRTGEDQCASSLR